MFVIDSVSAAPIVISEDSGGNRGDDFIDTMGIEIRDNLLLTGNGVASDWYCDNISNSVGINFFTHSNQRWEWHPTLMPSGAFDPTLEMAEGYQISTSNGTNFTFIGI